MDCGVSQPVAFYSLSIAGYLASAFVPTARHLTVPPPPGRANFPGGGKGGSAQLELTDAMHKTSLHVSAPKLRPVGLLTPVHPNQLVENLTLNLWILPAICCCYWTHQSRNNDRGLPVQVKVDFKPYVSLYWKKLERPVFWISFQNSQELSRSKTFLLRLIITSQTPRWWSVKKN